MISESKKAPAPRLSADDVMSRAKLKSYQNTYAAAKTANAALKGINSILGSNKSMSFIEYIYHKTPCISRGPFGLYKDISINIYSGKKS